MPIFADTWALDQAWRPVKVGAGGWLTGIDIAADGTTVVRTDTYGAYVMQADGTWKQLITVDSMPGSDIARSGGVYEIAVSDGNSNIMYMSWGGDVYRTDNKGASWTKTAFPHQTQLDPNDGFRTSGQKMAIDPNNPDVVLVGTQRNGMWSSRDGGETWTRVAALDGSVNDAGVTGIVITGSGTVYASAQGKGVMQSTDGGLTFSALPAGGPLGIDHATVDKVGNYYATGGISEDGLWKFTDATNTWTKVLSSGGIHNVAIDPFDNNHIIVANEGGSLQESHDGGKTWGDGWNWANKLESTGEIPWLENSGGYMSNGGLVFDPQAQGKIWMSAGVGVWHADLPKDFTWATPIVWSSQSVGIEQLVTNDIISPPGGDPIFASWDRPFFTIDNPEEYEEGYSAGDGSKGFSMGWSVDYASTNPSFLVGISDWWGGENSGYSADGGASWQAFAGLPTHATSSIGGSVAVSTPNNFIWAPANGGTPAYTLDGGTTWADVDLPNHADWGSFHFAYYLNRQTVTADRVDPNSFYLYDAGSGLYNTQDGGQSWTMVYQGQITDWSYYNAKIEAVPGSEGELFFTNGPSGSNEDHANQAFAHSTDGGHTWEMVQDVTEVYTFGFGAPKDQGGPASIQIVGYVGEDFGIWQSDDNAESWFKIGENPLGSLDQIRTISGDMNQYGRVYVGFGGSGYAYLPSATVSGVPTPSIGTMTPDTAVVNDHVTGASVLTLAGTAGVNTIVNVFDGATLLGSVPVYASGAWTFTTGSLSEGVHSLTATASDSTGTTSAPSSVFAVTIDFTPPAAPSIAAAGSSALVNTGLAAVADTGLALTISGTAEANSIVKIYDGTALLGSATTSGTGMWSYNCEGLSVGSHSFTATATDGAGNESAASQPLDQIVGAPTAAFTSGTLKSNGAYVLKGTSDLGNVIEIYEGATLVGTTTTNEYGQWSLTTAVQSKTSHTFTATVTDIAGNIGEATGNAIYGVKGSKLTGSLGDDIYWDGGNTTFVFNDAEFGNDLITSFLAGKTAGHDVIQFDHTTFSNFTEVMANAVQVGSNVVITYDADNTITLSAVKLGSLSAVNFLFAQIGDSGANVLKGSADRDVLIGGGGADLLIGGAGSDTFEFRFISNSLPSARDTIEDFVRSLDRIDLREIDANTSAAGDQAFTFIGSGGFRGRPAELNFVNGVLSGDVNGDKVADFQIGVKNVTSLTSTDFWL